MSADSAYPGIDHVTVVPTNYRPDDSEGGDADAEGSDESATAE
ncbi:hypothetical protein [Halopelagius longus]|uniref:Uncharacterized protein n=1 Tax=Halopelagius longus TaxID=1236180 RepID=A0A1H1DBD7_9EURY|nr:hypothetical protein [Halopelagius longus]SDQ73519.1 hypothetical protein SAMN05216278_2316 [Halopelagius longus]